MINNITYNNLFKDHERFDEAFRKFFFQSESVEGNIIVCHANIIWYIVCRLVKYEFFNNMYIQQSFYTGVCK